MSVDDVGRCLQHRLQGSGLDILNFTILPPPYRDGLVRANIQFFSPAAARTATSYLNRQKPMCTGRIRIIARYEQTLSYSIPLDEYCWMREDLAVLCSSITVLLSATRLHDLKFLKSEFENLRGGETVKHEGKVIWEEFFGLPAGRSYLRELEAIYPGIMISEMSRHKIVLFGRYGIRNMVKAAILHKYSEIQTIVEKRSFPLGSLTPIFIRMEFSALSQTLGSEKLILSLGKLVPRCPICLEELDCAVTSCRSCLVHYLKAAIDNKWFPLTCLGDDNSCSCLFPISLAHQLLSYDDFDSLVKAVFEDYIHQSPKEFHRCPSPSCMQVYRTAPRGSKLRLCPSCLLRICSQCHDVYHDGGLDCGPDLADENSLFNRWAATHDVKSDCPSLL
ncbi:hypothetical protein C8R42DRAFT_694193 [Lentinula raphanica]|nr:hypothetical protein C8R42DRAFT_694193 [Lentinula raphanica]